jgi:hypothetical protein
MVSWSPINVNLQCETIDKVLGFPIAKCLDTNKNIKHSFVLLNVWFHGLHSKNQTIPDGFDRYILGFWFEVFEERDFQALYQRNPNAEFIILTDLNADAFSHHTRCRVINFYHYRWFIENIEIPPIDWTTKSYKLSSLSNRINEFRYFVTAKLLDAQQVYFTWNRHDVGANIDYILQPAGSTKRDSLLATHKHRLEQKINVEVFDNNPLANTKMSQHPAYRNSFINCMNESKDVSWTPEFGFCPAPYLTEKTWKPIFFGNAVIFTGQSGTKKHLEKIGFSFEYPWSNAYDDVTGDLTRLEMILDTIDHVLSLDSSQILMSIRDSVEHNQNFVKAGRFQSWIDEQNAHALAKLEEYL